MIKKIKYVLIAILITLNIIIFSVFLKDYFSYADISLHLKPNYPAELNITYSNNTKNFSEENHFYLQENLDKPIKLRIPSDTTYIKIVFAENSTGYMELIKTSITKRLVNQGIIWDIGGTENVDLEASSIFTVDDAEDSFVILKLEESTIERFLVKSYQNNIIKIISILLIIDALMFAAGFFLMKSEILKDVVLNIKMILSLAKNDFINKYSGSFFGILWAFVPPVVTIGIYIFVFQIGFKAAPAGGYPYVLWLTAGIIPWFYFAENLVSTTSCLIEYSYLVKKVVFNISILPVVKLVSNFVTHFFFIVITMIIGFILGYPPNLMSLQLIYYMTCLFALSFSLSYLLAAITPFFRDFGQIIGVITQVGTWLTPIMWNIDMISQKLQFLFKLNPLFYIVEGYRDSYLGRQWFFTKPVLGIYFWGFVLVTFIFSTKIFQKLKIHFADVL